MSKNLSKYALAALLSAVQADKSTSDGSDNLFPLPIVCEYSVALPNPKDYEKESYIALVKQQFVYLKQCSDTDEVSFANGARLMRNIMESEGVEDLSYQNLVKTFITLDLNMDEQLTLKEILQFKRTLEEPFDLEDNHVPYTDIMDQLFEYMDYEVVPNVDGLHYDGYITRENLKAMQPILFPEDQANDELIIREMRLRDYDRDGKIDVDEHISYIWHYNYMVSFWNQVKGYESDKPIDLTETMTREEFIVQHNPWLRREPEYRDDDSLIIPDEKFENFFYYFDVNHDGKLTFGEVWPRTQEPDMRWRDFHEKLMHPIDTNDDLFLSLEEIRNYLKVQQPELSEEDLQSAAEALMRELSEDDDNVLDRWEAWRKYNWMHDQMMRRREKEERSETDFQQGWYQVDLNRDRVITAAEFLAVEHVYGQEIMEFFVADGEELNYDTVYNWIVDVERPLKENIIDPLWIYVFDKDEDGVAYLDDFISVEYNLLALWHVLGKEEQDADLDQKKEFAIEFFNQIDGYLKEADGKITKVDVCKYYFEGDHTFICGQDDEETSEEKAKAETQNVVELAEEIFEKVDVDQTGEIGKTEFVEVYQEITERIKDETVNEISEIPVSDLVNGLKDELTDLIKQIIAQ